MLQRLENLGQSLGGASDESNIAKKIQDFQARNADVENRLKAAEGYFKEVSR